MPTRITDQHHRLMWPSGTRRLTWAASALALLTLVSCTCDRLPAAPPEATPEKTAPTAIDMPSPSPEAPAPAASPEQAQQATRISEAASLVHEYLGALAARDFARADARWRDGRPPPVADDALLRNLPELQSMKIRNAAPIPLDKVFPTRAVEVPVTLRLVSPQGQARYYDAKYRLSRTLDDRGWQISSASAYARVD